MSRLLTVVNERKKLRSEYRKVLEDEYIAKKKQEEQESYKAEVEKLKEQGIKIPPSEEEIKELLKAKSAKRMEEYGKIFETLKEKAAKEDTVVSPLLNEKDLQLSASA